MTHSAPRERSRRGAPAPRGPASLAALAAAFACGLLLPGCASNPTDGWSTASSFPSGYRTVAVPVFENPTYDRSVGYQLTDAVVKEIQQNTPYRVTSEAKADTVLRGTIREVRRRELSKSLATGLSEEMVLQVTVDYEWVDMKTGKPIVARQGFSSGGTFIASRPQAEPIDLGNYNVVQQLAGDIVASMQTNW